MSKRGRPALGENKRTVKVSPHFTASEAARLDAVRGDTDRAVLARDAVLREVRRREASERAKAARAALVMP